MITTEELDKRFDYHRPTTNEMVDRIERIRVAMKSHANFILSNTSPCREQSLAITALEEAQMWAIAAIVRNEE